MEENKELETTTEEQASVTPAANDGEKKGLFLCLVNGQVDDFICRHVLMIGRRLPQHR